MSTATKLEYLNDTKSLLKESINSLGGNITSQTTFRQYATELDSIYASLPKVSGSGSNISLSPTRKGRITSQINGDTFQQTYTGKNINSKGIRNGLYQISNGNYASSPGYVTLEDLLPATYGDTITVSTQAGLTGNFYILEYDENKTYLNVNNNVRNVTSATFTISDTNTKYIAIDYINNTSGSATIYGGIQIETGSSVSPYEPYVGGTASPNPDYPQEIQSVTGLQKIINVGKNLLNLNGTIVKREAASYSNISITNNSLSYSTTTSTAGYLGFVIPIEIGKTYTLTKGTTSSGSIYTIELDTPITEVGTNYGTYRSSNYTFTATKKYLGIWLNVQGNSSGSVSNIQLEVGSTATEYEAYSGETYDINLGDIHLYENDQIIGTPDNWSIKHNIKEITLKGTEYGWKNDSQNKLCGLSISDIKTITSAQVTTALCDHYTATDLSTSRTSNNYFSQNSTDVWFNNQGMDVNTYKTYLATNNLKLVYELATPTTTPITDTTLINDLNNFYYALSKNGETNISVDGNLPMILDISALKGEE